MIKANLDRYQDSIVVSANTEYELKENIKKYKIKGYKNFGNTYTLRSRTKIYEWRQDMVKVNK